MKIEQVWTTKTGLLAVCVMHDMGHRCGYVAVPKSHPLHGVHYSEPTLTLRPLVKARLEKPIGKMGIITAFCLAAGGMKDMDRLSAPEVIIEVHGGLTFAGTREDWPAKITQGRTSLWWFGFDCAHDGDGTMYRHGPECPIRSLSYVVEECEGLSEQLASIRPLGLLWRLRFWLADKLRNSL